MNKYVLLSVIVATVGVVVLLFLFLYPLIPVEVTVPKTTTKNLQYSSEVFYPQFNRDAKIYGYYVNVTNQDSVGGIFTVTINYLNINGQPMDRLVKSVFIGSGETAKFAPESEADSYSYAVSAPSVQESHNESRTEYKSMLNYLTGQ